METKKNYKKYPLNSIYFAYNRTGSFFEPFYYNKFDPSITRIDSGRIYLLDKQYPRYYDKLKRLFGLRPESVIYYQPAYSIVAKRTAGANISGEIFKPVRYEIEKFEGQLDRNSILKAGIFNDLWVDYNDLHPLMCQLKEELRNYNQKIKEKTFSETGKSKKAEKFNLSFDDDSSYDDLSVYADAINKYLQEEDEFPPIEF